MRSGALKISPMVSLPLSVLMPSISWGVCTGLRGRKRNRRRFISAFWMKPRRLYTLIWSNAGLRAEAAAVRKRAGAEMSSCCRPGGNRVVVVAFTAEKEVLAGLNRNAQLRSSLYFLSF